LPINDESPIDETSLDRGRVLLQQMSKIRPMRVNGDAFFVTSWPLDGDG
jgi:hypothetical protein